MSDVRDGRPDPEVQPPAGGGSPVTEGTVRRQLADTLNHVAPGTLMLLLTEVLEGQAEAAGATGDTGRRDQLLHCSHAAYVLGLGMYATLPK